MSVLRKNFYRVFNRIKFKEYKREQETQKSLKELLRISKNKYNIESKEIFFIKHSGLAGDVIYSLPMIKALAELSLSKKVCLFLAIDKQAEKCFGPRKAILSENSFYGLKPLLERQSYIHSVRIYNNETLDFDLDDFRAVLSDSFLSRGSISKWYQYLIPVCINLESPWLTVEKSELAKDSILINRTTRYNMHGITYLYLNEYENVCFVGLEDEYNKAKEEIKNLKWLQTRDYLELAEIISGAKLFIGSQSSPFAIAEALKVNRILETIWN